MFRLRAAPGRRNVMRVALAYAGAAWGIMHAHSIVLET